MLDRSLFPVLGVFMPHGFCYRWDPSVIWLHVGSDALIALSYFAIPVGLIQLIRRRTDLAFGWMFGCFALFIVACGATHVMEILTVWVPAYRASGMVKAITALASVPTAILLLKVVLPAAARLPSPTQLRKVNEALQREVTARRQTEQELTAQAEALARSNRDLQQFAYAASHDLREPLRMVSSYCQLLQETEGDRLGPEAERYIRFAVDGSKRMQALIDALLAYSQVSSRAIAQQPVDLEQTFAAVMQSLQLAIRDSEATITHDSLPTVNGDPTLLNQLLQNLISNALKFRRAEPVRIHVSVKTEMHEHILSVRDNGIGISAEYQQKIFVMFQRLHAPGTYPGTGIGLALCQRIAERLDGRIWVESQPEYGSTFFVSLPRPHAQIPDTSANRHPAG